MSKAKVAPQIDLITVGKKKYKRGMKKPLKLPKYDFPSDFWEVETKKVESK